MCSFLRVEHQLGFSGSETIRTKQNAEKLALEHGVIVDSYQTNTGVFNSNAFVSRIMEHNQKLSYYRVNVYHKNGAAERII